MTEKRKKTFTKRDLVKKLDKVLYLPKQEIKRMVDLIFHLILKEAKQDKSVIIQNFGTFKITHTKPTTRINPVTNANMQLSSRRVMRFKPSPYTRCYLNPHLFQEIKKFNLSNRPEEYAKKQEELEQLLFADPFAQWYE